MKDRVLSGLPDLGMDTDAHAITSENEMKNLLRLLYEKKDVKGTVRSLSVRFLYLYRASEHDIYYIHLNNV